MSTDFIHNIIRLINQVDAHFRKLKWRVEFEGTFSKLNKDVPDNIRKNSGIALKIVPLTYDPFHFRRVFLNDGEKTHQDERRFSFQFTHQMQLSILSLYLAPSSKELKFSINSQFDCTHFHLKSKLHLSTNVDTVAFLSPH